MPTPIGLPPLLVGSQEQIEQALRAHMDGLANGGLELYRMMRYGLGWIEQDGTPALHGLPTRLHGALCLEAWSALSPAASRQDGDLATVARSAVEGAIEGAKDIGVAAEDAASAAATGAIDAATQISESAGNAVRDAATGTISGVRVVAQAPFKGEEDKK